MKSVSVNDRVNSIFGSQVQSNRGYSWRDCIKRRLDDLGCIELWKRYKKMLGKKSTKVRSCKFNRLIDADS